MSELLIATSGSDKEDGCSFETNLASGWGLQLLAEDFQGSSSDFYLLSKVFDMLWRVFAV